MRPCTIDYKAKIWAESKWLSNGTTSDVDDILKFKLRKLHMDFRVNTSGHEVYLVLSSVSVI